MKINMHGLMGLWVVLALAAGGCSSPGKRTAAGAGIGAAGGGVVGGAVGGGWKGAAIGAGVGALAGGAVGNYLDKQANELEKVAETTRTEQGILVNLKNDVLFDTGKSDVKPEAMTQLNQVGGILAKYPEDRVKIEGFTDSVGTTSRNAQLSERRAAAVSSILTNQGVKPAQIVVAGMGEERPVADNSTTDGRAKNRRVELHIDVPQAPPAG